MNLSPTDPRQLAPQTGTAFPLKSGQRLEVIDVEGQQVSDLFCVTLNDRNERLSSGRTIDYNDTIYQTTGHWLYSNRSRPLFEIIEDKVGRHDFFLTPCSLEMFHVVTGEKKHHPSCHENLERALRDFGVIGDDIGSTFNIFMNVVIDPNGKLSILPPRSKAGDSITFLAKTDLIVGLTACSDEQTNNGRLKPISYRIY